MNTDTAKLLSEDWQRTQSKPAGWSGPLVEAGGQSAHFVWNSRGEPTRKVTVRNVRNKAKAETVWPSATDVPEKSGAEQWTEAIIEQGKALAVTVVNYHKPLTERQRIVAFIAARIHSEFGSNDKGKISLIVCHAGKLLDEVIRQNPA